MITRQNLRNLDIKYCQTIIYYCNGWSQLITTDAIHHLVGCFLLNFSNLSVITLDSNCFLRQTPVLMNTLSWSQGIKSPLTSVIFLETVYCTECIRKSNSIKYLFVPSLFLYQQLFLLFKKTHLALSEFSLNLRKTGRINWPDTVNALIQCSSISQSEFKAITCRFAMGAN